MPDSSRVPLRLIAEKTGLTRMAVSLALRGRSGVSRENRERVLKAAADLGYEPDPEKAKLLSHIRMRHNPEVKACLALLTSGRTPDAWKHFITERKYVEGARDRAAEYGYRMDEFWIGEPGMTMSRLSSIIASRGIEGIIIAPLQQKLSDHAPRTIDLNFDLFSAVEISETVEKPDLNRCIHDQYTAMLKVLDGLAGLNYRSPGFVIEEALDLRVNGKWTAAYLYYRHRHGPKSMPPPLIMETASQAVFDRWFDRHQPDAIISVDRFGLRFLQRRGLKIPREVGYASLDIDGDAEAHPGISGIDQHSRMVGAAAVDMLIAAIHRGQQGITREPVRMEVEGDWIAGNTTRKLRAPRA